MCPYEKQATNRNGLRLGAALGLLGNNRIGNLLAIRLVIPAMHALCKASPSPRALPEHGEVGLQCCTSLCALEYGRFFPAAGFTPEESLAPGCAPAREFFTGVDCTSAGNTAWDRFS